MRSEREKYTAMIEWRLNACWSIQREQQQRMKEKTVEKKIKHDAVLEHQRAHNHRESSLLRFGSERERRVQAKKREKCGWVC